MRLKYIDALRGIAALAVVVAHLYAIVAAQTPLPSPLHEIALSGSVGVHVFFVLSGFVICHSIQGHEIDAGFVGRFALRRSLRLDPPYWLVIFASAAIAVTMGREITTGQVAINMLYLDNITRTPSIVAVGWTLCLELQFYLALVLLTALEQRIPHRLARAAVFVPVLLVAFVWSIAPPWPGVFLEWWPLFFAGVVIRWNGRVETMIVMSLVLGALALDRQDVGFLVASGAVWSIWILQREKRLHVLGARGWQFFGRISYSLYLVGPIAASKTVRWIERNYELTALTSLALFCVGLAVSIGGAWVFWRVAERPAIELARRVSLRPAAKRKEPAIA